MRDSAVRTVPSANPNSSPTATSARTGNLGGWVPSSVLSINDRAVNGSMPRSFGSRAMPTIIAARGGSGDRMRGEEGCGGHGHRVAILHLEQMRHVGYDG